MQNNKLKLYIYLYVTYVHEPMERQSPIHPNKKEKKKST